MNGILAIDKEKDYTSFDVVAKLRGILSMRKIGHGGTLDPMATGVLPLFLGSSTKIISLIPDMDKEYIADFQLGIETDTQDITGNIVNKSYFHVTKQLLSEKITTIIGEIYQVPPMYSAVKVNGQRLYKLARQGKEIKRDARKVTVYNIQIISFNEETQSGRLKIYSSKGTYVRTLIHDLGIKLNTFATLTSLRRIKALGIDISKCYTLRQIEEVKDNKLFLNLNYLIKPEEILSSYPKIYLNDDYVKKFSNGAQFYVSSIFSGYHRIYNELKQYIGIGKVDNNILKVVAINSEG